MYPFLKYQALYHSIIENMLQPHHPCVFEAGDCVTVSRYILMHFLRPCGRTHLATES